MVMDSHEFAVRVITHSDKYATRLKELVLDPVQDVDEEQIIRMCKYHMWTEFMLGVRPPAKQLTLLPDDDVECRLRLAKQISDEYRHSLFFSEILKDWGEDGDLVNYEPPQTQYQLFLDTYAFDTPIEIAASLQVTGEVVLMTILRRLKSFVAKLKGDDLAEELDREVIVDEGDHILTGRKILETYATTEESQQRVVEVSELKFESLCNAYGLDFYSAVKGMV